MSASPQADVAQHGPHVRDVPKAEACSSTRPLTSVTRLGGTTQRIIITLIGRAEPWSVSSAT